MKTILTQKGMCESLKLYNLCCCQTTISNNLKKIGFTHKRLTKIQWKEILKELLA